MTNTEYEAAVLAVVEETRYRLRRWGTVRVQDGTRTVLHLEKLPGGKVVNVRETVPALRQSGGAATSSTP